MVVVVVVVVVAMNIIKVALLQYMLQDHRAVRFVCHKTESTLCVKKVSQNIFGQR